MRRNKRQQREAENSLDRRKISLDSMEELATLIQDEDTDGALRKMFNILTGEQVDSLAGEPDEEIEEGDD